MPPLLFCQISTQEHQEVTTTTKITVAPTMPLSKPRGRGRPPKQKNFGTEAELSTKGGQKLTRAVGFAEQRNFKEVQLGSNPPTTRNEEHPIDASTTREPKSDEIYLNSSPSIKNQEPAVQQARSLQQEVRVLFAR